MNTTLLTNPSVAVAVNVSPPSAGIALNAEHFRIAGQTGSNASGSSKALRKAQLRAELARQQEATSRAREATLAAEIEELEAEESYAGSQSDTASQAQYKHRLASVGCATSNFNPPL